MSKELNTEVEVIFCENFLFGLGMEWGCPGGLLEVSGSTFL